MSIKYIENKDAEQALKKIASLDNSINSALDIINYLKNLYDNKGRLSKLENIFINASAVLSDIESDLLK